jgi:hypothetical protein
MKSQFLLMNFQIFAAEISHPGQVSSSKKRKNMKPPNSARQCISFPSRPKHLVFFAGESWKFSYSDSDSLRENHDKPGTLRKFWVFSDEFMWVLVAPGISKNHCNSTRWLKHSSLSLNGKLLPCPCIATRLWGHLEPQLPCRLSDRNIDYLFLMSAFESLGWSNSSKEESAINTVVNSVSDFTCRGSNSTSQSVSWTIQVFLIWNYQMVGQSF